MGKKRATAEYMNSLQDQPVDQVGPGKEIKTKLSDMLQSRYKGIKNIPETRALVEGSAKAILTGLVLSGDIESYQGLMASTDPVEPRAILVMVEILLPNTINYILIECSLL